MEEQTTTKTKQDTKSVCDALGDRMKEYERDSTTRLDPTRPWIVRLDGHKFSKFTKSFVRPYDVRIHEAMLETAKALLKEFNPVSVFTCSDEITMVFQATAPLPGEEIEPVDETKEKRTNPQNDMPYGGKVQKIVSLFAGFATAQFNASLKAGSYDNEKESKLAEHVRTSLPYFDARAHNVPHNAEAFNNVFWRSRYDYRRNSIAGLAQYHFPHRELQGLNTGKMLAKLLEEKNVNWHDCPGWYKFGTLVKRESYVLRTTTPKGEEVEAVRTRVTHMPFAFETFSPEAVRTVLCKALKTDEVQEKETTSPRS